MHVFYYDLYDQSDEFNVIGQQVSYCRRPRATCHILHWSNIMPEGRTLWLGNN